MFHCFQDSEEDECEETEEEFLERYAKAADELSEMVEEGDIEDEAQELELGKTTIFLVVCLIGLAT